MINMKKLLGILGTITIAGSGTAGLVGNAPAPAKNEINYQQTNNLETLNRAKRANNNKIENWFCFLCHNRLVAKISHNNWKRIQNEYNIRTRDSLYNFVYALLKNEFEKRNSSGDFKKQNDFVNEDIEIIANSICDHFLDINQVFLNKNNDNIGLFIRTNRKKYWENNDKSNGFWGAYPNIKENEFKHSFISGVSVFLTPKLWNLITLYHDDNLLNFDKYSELFIDRVYDSADTLIGARLRSKDLIWKVSRIIWNNWEKINDIWKISDKNHRIKIKMDFSLENKDYLKQDVYLTYFSSEIEETDYTNIERNI